MAINLLDGGHAAKKGKRPMAFALPQKSNPMWQNAVWSAC
jgi:lysophospholipase L1-like esterase